LYVSGVFGRSGTSIESVVEHDGAFAAHAHRYLFTDAMTIIDHKGRNARIYRPEEVHYDGVTREQYMDRLVSQTELILTNEPADIYANPPAPGLGATP